MILRRIKEETIHSLARIGRKYRMLRYPALAVLVIFVFIYNLFLYGFIHFRMRERLARGLAMAMTVVLLFTGVNITAFAMSGESVAPEDSITPESTVSDGNAGGLSEAVIALQQRIDALPSVEEFTDMADGTYVEDSLWNEAQMTIYYEMQEIADIYDSLPEEEQAQVELTKLLELFEYINSAVMPLVNETVHYEPITISADSLNGNAIWGATENKQEVAMDDSAHFYSVSRNVDGGLPIDGKITMPVSRVTYQLATGDDPSKAYDGNDCIRLTADNHASKMELETIGVYQNIYVFATAGGPGTGNYADFSVTLYYTDGTTQTTSYALYDWYDLTDVSNVEKFYNVKRMNNDSEAPDGSSATDRGPVIHSAAIPVEPSKLLESIEFKMDAKVVVTNGTQTRQNLDGLYCCIFAVTGATPSGVPDRPVATQATKQAGDATGAFTANWEAVDGATGYYLDVSADRQFKDFVGNYNNLPVGNVLSYEVSESVADNTVYYYRVRAVNAKGQSLSSNRIATDLPIWIKQALKPENQIKVSYDAETNTVTFNDNVTLTDTIKLPGDEEVTIDLKTNTVTAPEGKPAIAASGSGTSLKVIGSSEGDRQGTLTAESSGNSGGSATIDFSSAGSNSTITVSGSCIKGGDGTTAKDGTTAGAGGVGIAAGSDVNIEVGENAKVSGGNGGSAQNGIGGNGGAGISGGNVSVTQNGSITGGNGGDSAKGNGGTGGNGIENSTNINTEGTVYGGNGGNSSNGYGGKGGTGVSGIDGDKVTNTGNVTGGNGGDGTNGIGYGGEAGLTGNGAAPGGNGSIVHEHTWTYMTDGNGAVLAYCTRKAEEGECRYYGTKNAIRFTLTAENATYDGNVHKTATISENEITKVTGAEPGEITYYSDGDVITEPKNVGIYTAKATLKDQTAWTTYRITKASQNVTASMPDYTYGETVAIPGITGTMEKPEVTYYYNKTDSNSNGTEWKNITATTLPVGEYYLYAVLGDTPNYLESTTATVKFRVLPRIAEISWGECNLFYNGREQAPTATVNNLVGDDSCTVTVSGAQKDANEKTGEERYTATATALGNPNYVLPEGGAGTKFTISVLELKNPGDLVEADLDADGDVYVTVRDPFGENDEKLIPDEDYTLTKEETAQDYIITIEGKGNYAFKVIRKIAKPQGKGDIISSVVTEPAMKRINPELKPVSEQNAKKTLIASVKNPELKQRLENADPRLNYQALLYLEVKQADSTLTTEKKKLITDSIATSKVLPVQTVVGKYIDLSLYLSYTISNSNSVLESGTEKITDISDKQLGSGEGYKQMISLTIPEELRVSDSSIVRNYYIIRAHEEENGATSVEVLDTVRDGYILTFATDKFSTYAIAYADQKKQESTDDPGKQEGSGNNQNNQSGQNDDKEQTVQEKTQSMQSVSAPKTGDDSHLMLWIVLLALSVIGMAGIGAANYRKGKKS